MKRYELLNDKDTAWNDVAKPICDGLAENNGCCDCPFYDRCMPGHNGVMDFLMEEVTE